MPEAMKLQKDLGPDIDSEGNLVTQEKVDSSERLDLAGVSFEEAYSQIDQIKQVAGAPYIELKKKIEGLPTFERGAINDVVADYLSQIPIEQRDLVRSADVVQLLLGSSRPLGHWKKSQFYTNDGEFEKFILGKVKPAVDGMTEDLQSSN